MYNVDGDGEVDEEFTYTLTEIFGCGMDGAKVSGDYNQTTGKVEVLALLLERAWADLHNGGWEQIIQGSSHEVWRVLANEPA